MKKWSINVEAGKTCCTKNRVTSSSFPRARKDNVDFWGEKPSKVLARARPCVLHYQPTRQGVSTGKILGMIVMGVINHILIGFEAWTHRTEFHAWYCNPDQKERERKVIDPPDLFC